MIRLYNDLYIADPWPAAYLSNIDAVIVADLHLGIEGALQEEGLYLPKKASQYTQEIVYNIIEDVKPSKVIVAGDLKHSFGLLNREEWIEIRRFIRRLVEDYKIDMLVVRGNHDNYLGVLLDKFGVPFVERYDIGIYSIIHGHKDYPLDQLNEVILMGHEHPSITIRDELGVRYKYKCFLWGEFNGNRLLILPPLSELATGSSFTEYEYLEPLSPILKRVDIGRFKPYPIIIGEIVKELPELKVLRTLL